MLYYNLSRVSTAILAIMIQKFRRFYNSDFDLQGRFSGSMLYQQTLRPIFSCFGDLKGAKLDIFMSLEGQFLAPSRIKR